MPKLPDIQLPKLPDVGSLNIPSRAELAQGAYEAVDVAGSMLRKFMRQIREFEKTLDAAHEVGFSAATNSGFEPIFIDQIVVLRPETLMIHGENIDGERIMLMQHVSQFNLMFRAIKKRHETAVRIGFDLPIREG